MDQGEVPVSTNVEPTQPNGASESQESQTTLDEMIKRETHQRVLKESQKYKQRAVEAEAKNNQLEEAKLNEQKQYKELADRYKSERDELKATTTTLQLKTQLMPLLTQAGCRDVVDAMKLGNNELLLSDPDNDKLVGVEDYVKDLQLKKPWLFDTGKPSSVNPSLPSPGNSSGVGSKEDINNLSVEEVNKRLAQIDKLQKAGK